MNLIIRILCQVHLQSCISYWQVTHTKCTRSRSHTHMHAHAHSIQFTLSTIMTSSLGPSLFLNVSKNVCVQALNVTEKSVFKRSAQCGGLKSVPRRYRVLNKECVCLCVSLHEKTSFWVENSRSLFGKLLMACHTYTLRHTLHEHWEMNRLVFRRLEGLCKPSMIGLSIHKKLTRE